MSSTHPRSLVHRLQRKTALTVGALIVVGALLAFRDLDAQAATRKAPPAADAGSTVHFALTGGLGLPAGDLGQHADVGLALGARAETRLGNPNWGMRGDLSWDHYDSQGAVNSYSYLAFAGNLVHHERGGRFYEFGGLGIYHSRIAFTNTSNADDTNLGTQAGVGIRLHEGQPSWFTEIGFTSAFTSGRSSLWFPLRFGLWF